MLVLHTPFGRIYLSNTYLPLPLSDFWYVSCDMAFACRLPSSIPPYRGKAVAGATPPLLFGAAPLSL